MAETVEIRISGSDAGAGAVLDGVASRLDRLRGIGGALGGAFSSLAGSLTSPFRALSGVMQQLFSLPNMLAGGIGGMLVKSTLDFADAIDEVAVKTGLTRETLQGLRLSAEQNKASFAVATTGLMYFARNAEAARGGAKEQQEAFARLGVTMKDLETLGTEGLFRRVADALAKIPTERRGAALGELMGTRSGMQMAGMFDQGAAGIDAATAKLRAMGALLSGDSIRKLADLKDKFAELKIVALGALGQALGGKPGDELAKTVDLIEAKIASLAQSGALTEFAKNTATALATARDAALAFFSFVRENKDWLVPLGITAVGVKVIMDTAAAFVTLGQAIKLAASAAAAAPAVTAATTAAAAAGTTAATVVAAAAGKAAGGGALAGAAMVPVLLAGATAVAGALIGNEIGKALNLSQVLARLLAGKSEKEAERAPTKEEIDAARRFRQEKLATLAPIPGAPPPAAAAAAPAVAAPALDRTQWQGTDDLSRVIRRAEADRGRAIDTAEVERAAAMAGESLATFQALLRGGSRGVARSDTEIARAEPLPEKWTGARLAAAAPPTARGVALAEVSRAAAMTAGAAPAAAPASGSAQAGSAAPAAAAAARSPIVINGPVTVMADSPEEFAAELPRTAAPEQA